MIYIEGNAADESSVDLAFARLAGEIMNLAKANHNPNNIIQQSIDKNRSKCLIM